MWERRKPSQGLASPGEDVKSCRETVKWYPHLGLSSTEKSGGFYISLPGTGGGREREVQM